MKTDDSRDMGDPDSSAPMTFADHVHHLADVLASDLGADLCDPDDDASRPGDVRNLRLMHDLACGAGADCPGHDGGARGRREDDPGLPDEVRLLAESLMGRPGDPRDPMRPFAEIARGHRHAEFSEGDGYAMFGKGGGKVSAKPAPGKSAPHASTPGGCGTGAGGFKAGNTCGHAKHRNATVEAARSAHTAARAEVSGHLKAHRKAVKDAAKAGGAAPAPKELHAAVRKAAAAHAGYRAAREAHRAEQRDRRNAARREGRKAKKAEGGKPAETPAKPAEAPRKLSPEARLTLSRMRDVRDYGTHDVFPEEAKRYRKIKNRIEDRYVRGLNEKGAHSPDATPPAARAVPPAVARAIEGKRAAKPARSAKSKAPEPKPQPATPAAPKEHSAAARYDRIKAKLEKRRQDYQNSDEAKAHAQKFDAYQAAHAKALAAQTKGEKAAAGKERDEALSKYRESAANREKYGRMENRESRLAKALVSPDHRQRASGAPDPYVVASSKPHDMGQYAAVPRAGHNVVVDKGGTPKDHERRKELVARLDAYERHYADQWNGKNPPKREEHAHSAALMHSGLTPEGLRTARYYAGKRPSDRGGIHYPDRHPSA